MTAKIGTKWCSIRRRKACTFRPWFGRRNTSSRATLSCWFWRRNITKRRNTFATMMSTLPSVASATSKPQACDPQAPVLANDFRRQWEDLRADSLDAFDAIGRSGWYVLGKEVREFENSLAAWWGFGHAVG